MNAIQECDRCGRCDDVQIIDWCPQCGPVPLCVRCREYHRQEIEDEAKYEAGYRLIGQPYPELYDEGCP
jgi:hypothetical protein